MSAHVQVQQYDRLRWCEQPVLLKVLVHAFDEVAQSKYGARPVDQLVKANRIRAWLDRVSARV